MRVSSIFCVIASLLLSGCGEAPAAEAPLPVARVIVLQFSHVMDRLELVSPSPLGIDLAIREAVEEGTLSPDSGLSVIETAGAEPQEVAASASELAGDPAVIAAIVTPFVDAPLAEHALVDAGVPVFSFSGHGGVPEAPEWRRLVPTAASEAEALAAAAGSEPCVTGDAPRASQIDATRIDDTEATAVAERAIGAGCSGIVWRSDAAGAADLVRALRGAGSEITFVVSAAARSRRFAAETYPEAVGTVAVVPCRTLDVSTEESARRFVHAYQAAYFAAPGLCGAEGYALGRWLLGRGDRDDVALALSGAGEIAVPGGVLDLAQDAVVNPLTDAVVGVRWLPQSYDS